ncbi:MAG: universal stress protein [Rhodobacteraceae bacterium]|nr:universal stress protein [Paracoccaceae bacterium]
MVYKSIVSVVTDLEIDRAALDVAVAVARRNGGHLDVICLGIDRTQPGFYYAGANAVILQDNLAQAQEDALRIEGEVKARLEGADVSWVTVAATTQITGLMPFLAHRTRFADLVVLSKPYGKGRDHGNEAITESVLFEAKVPVLVVPDDHEMPSAPNKVVVGWNESKEALRAIRDAMPFLTGAGSVNIAVIDPPQHGPDRSDPGGALSQMLARHGVKVEVSVLAKTMPRVSDVLARHIGDTGADLLVMGAYGHSRFRESILGGATRNALELSKVPILMAH